MSLFNDILSNIQNKLNIQKESKDDIAKIISTVIGTTVTAEQFSIKDGVLRFKVQPTVRLAVKLKEASLKEALKEKNIYTIA